jgi:hypothetical protein
MQCPGFCFEIMREITKPHIQDSHSQSRSLNLMTTVETTKPSVSKLCGEMSQISQMLEHPTDTASQLWRT